MKGKLLFKPTASKILIFQISFRFSASDVKTLRVYLGAHDIKTGARSEHRVVRIIKHKDFDPRTLVNDIAILTLETPARMSNSIQTVCLPTYQDSFDIVLVDDQTMDVPNTIISDILAKATSA